MTISSLVNRWDYTGDASTTGFAYANKVFASTDLKVYVDGVLQTSGYTVTGVGETGGGNVVFGVAPAVDASIVIVRDVPYTQPTLYPESGAFPAKAHENGLDRVVILTQQNKDALDRSLRLAETDVDAVGRLPTKVNRSAMLFYWDEDGNPSAIAIADISTELDVLLTSPAAGQLLKWDGTNWVNFAPGLDDLDDVDLSTAAAVSGDLLQFDGSEFLPKTPGEAGLIKQGIHVANFPAATWKPSDTDGCAALAADESSTNDVMTEFLAFDASAIEYAQVSFTAPPSMDVSATLSGLIEYKEAAGASAHVSVWGIQAQAQGDGDTVDSAWPTAVEVNDTGTSGTRRFIAFSGLSIGGSFAAGDTITLRLYRKATDGSDTLDVDAHFIGAQVDLTIDEADDS